MGSCFACSLLSTIFFVRVATKNLLFQFERNLYGEQVDGVVMGSFLEPLMANEEKLENPQMMPAFYNRNIIYLWILVNTEWNSTAQWISRWNFKRTANFPFLEWWLSDIVSD